MKTAIYPGSFDPITYGHIDIVKRACRFCDKVVVAVLVNAHKTPLFSPEHRAKRIREVFSDFPNVEVVVHQGLLVDLIADEETCILKGVRNSADYEYEMQMALMNRSLHPLAETLLLPSAREWSFVSSSAVKELCRHHADISEFVPKSIEDDLRRVLCKEVR